MPAKITLYDLDPSPNSIKVRIALNYKELPFERIAVDPRDRASVIKVSGQPLTPVILHGETVVFDSAAILRYLDGNFRKAPRLFSEDYQTMSRIEHWERFGRIDLMEPVGIVFNQIFAAEKSDAELSRASALIHDRSAKIEEALGKGRWLVGDSMTAADVTCASCVYLGMLPTTADDMDPVRAFFARSMKLGEGRERTRDWAQRVMAFDK